MTKKQNPGWSCYFCGERVFMTFYMIPMCRACQEKFNKVLEVYQEAIADSEGDPGPTINLNSFFKKEMPVHEEWPISRDM